MSRKVLPLIFLFGFFPALCAQGQGSTCSYTTYTWNTHLRRSIDHRTISHLYSELQRVEVHQATGCSVCEEDQVEVSLPGIDPFRVCRLVAPAILSALDRAMEQGARIFSVTGYRVGMTKGEVDFDGNRTRFSNHSFGVAIDINDQQNGLYDHCLSFGANCRLLRGGAWIPGRVGSLTPDSPVVRAFKEIGWKWGGEIAGNQKDFMHFSPSGY